MFIKPTGIVIVSGHDVEEEEHPRFPVSGLLQFESLFDCISKEQQRRLWFSPVGRCAAPDMLLLL